MEIPNVSVKFKTSRWSNMKVSPVLLVIEIQLVIWAVELWLLFATLTDRPNVKPVEWFADCDPIYYQDFFKHFDITKTYRVENEHGSNGTVYQNALVRWINFDSNFGYLTLTCPRRSGTTCDVFNIWEDNIGDLRLLRNILDQSTANRSQEHILHVDENESIFSLCDQQKRLVTRFKLVPIDDTDFSNHTGTVCSAEYGSYLGGESCSHESILNMYENVSNDNRARGMMSQFGNTVLSKRPSDSKKRMLVVLPIVLAAIVGTVGIAKLIIMWINKVPEV